MVVGADSAYDACCVPDEGGGCYVIWRSRSPGVALERVFARHFMSNGFGDPAWPVSGVELAPATYGGVPASFVDGQLAPDGGLFVFLVDNGIPFARAFRLQQNGTLATGWPSSGVMMEPRGSHGVGWAVDESGGAWAVGHDDGYYCNQYSCVSDVLVFAVRLTPEGATMPGWGGYGRFMGALPRASTGEQIWPTRIGARAFHGGVALYLIGQTNGGDGWSYFGHLFPDGGSRFSVVDSMVYELSPSFDVDRDGAGYLSLGGYWGAGATKHQPESLWGPGWRYPDWRSSSPTVVKDGVGGLFSLTLDWSGTTDALVLNHIASNGAPDFGWASGVKVLQGAVYGSGIVLRNAGPESCFLAWASQGGADRDVLALRVRAGDLLPFGGQVEGVPVAAFAGSDQYDPRVACSSTGDVFLVWRDRRNGASHLYGQKFVGDQPVPVLVQEVFAELVGDAVALRWRIEGATSCVVERSVDEVAWIEVGPIEASDSSGDLWTAVDPSPIAGTLNRYRLHGPGGWTGGEISLYVGDLTKGLGVAVWPNPAVSGTRISVSSRYDAPVELTVVDLLGRVRARREVAAIRGTLSVPLRHIAELPAGIYWIRLRAGIEQAQARFVVVE